MKMLNRIRFSCIVVFVFVIVTDNQSVAEPLIGDYDTCTMDLVVRKTMEAMDAEEKSEMMEIQIGQRIIELPELPSNVDCFGLPSWLAKVLRDLFKPSDPKEVNTRFYLVTRAMRTAREIKLGDDFSLEGTGFDPSHRTVMIVHGFMNHGQENWIKEMALALLDKHELNVFAVDWSGGGGSWKYWRAVANTRVTGNVLTRFAEQLIEKAGMKKEDLHLIGHSLGAHICGYVSRNLNGAGRLTGLDPAQPCFRTRDPRMTMDKTDASFVDVIHTNGRMLSKLGLGLPDEIGHVDFYPNGGKTQPKCVNRTEKSLYQRVKDIYKLAVCSHGRAYMLFTETIREGGGCKFWGHRWNMTQPGTDAAMKAPCSAQNCAEMGINSEFVEARGSFYVRTSGDPPFCLADPNADVRMEEEPRKKTGFFQRVKNWWKSRRGSKGQ